MGAPPPNPRCVPFKVLVKSSLPVQSLNLNLAPNPSPRLNLQLTLPVLRKKCSPPRDANRCLCRPCPTATSGTVPAAEKPCGSSNASPRHNSIWHPSIPHDRLRQSGRPVPHTPSQKCVHIILRRSKTSFIAVPKRLDSIALIHLLTSSLHYRRRCSTTQSSTRPANNIQYPRSEEHTSEL